MKNAVANDDQRLVWKILAELPNGTREEWTLRPMAALPIPATGELADITSIVRLLEEAKGYIEVAMRRIDISVASGAPPPGYAEKQRARLRVGMFKIALETFFELCRRVVLFTHDDGWISTPNSKTPTANAS